MSFTLTDSGGLAAGQGFGTLFKAVALSDGARAKAELDAGLKSASINHHNAAAGKYNNEALILGERLGLMRDPMKAAMRENGVPLNQRGALESYDNTGSFGPQYDALQSDQAGPVLPPPVDPAKATLVRRALALASKANMTGSNAEQMGKLGEIEQAMRDRSAIVGTNPTARSIAQAYFATSGKAPFNNVGESGYSLDNITGELIMSNPMLAKLFADVKLANADQSHASAQASRASAGKHGVETELERAKLEVLRATGAFPGSGGADGGEGSLSSTILGTLNIPKLDEKGRTVINPLTGAQEMATDQDALKSFYGWADANKRKPTAAAFSTWEAQGRPGANKSPAAGGGESKITDAPTNKAVRQAGQVYQTPKGPMKWTGTGWLPQ